MNSPIKLKTLENSIEECKKHLEFLKESSSITSELIELIDKNKLDTDLLESLNIGAKISNIHCIITLTELEISIILKSLYHSLYEIESKQIIKNGILIIYETIKTLDQLGKILRELLNEFPEYSSDFEKYYYGLRKFKDNIKIDSTYKDIRNSIAGHQVSDFSEYIRVIDLINIEDQRFHLIQFKMIIDSLNKFLFNCFNKSNKNYF